MKKENKFFKNVSELKENLCFFRLQKKNQRSRLNYTTLKYISIKFQCSGDKKNRKIQVTYQQYHHTSRATTGTLEMYSNNFQILKEGSM